jgi:hypothetical protein
MSGASGARNFVLVTLDSCRYDAFETAHVPNLRGLGALQKRYSYASWTPPSHYAMLSGLLPHASLPHTHASAMYFHEFREHERRLGFPVMTQDCNMGAFYLPAFLRDHGYATHARVSMHLLDPAGPLNRGFDSYKLMPRINDFGAIIDDVLFDDGRPAFWLLNVGETHYPYALADDPVSNLPRMPGTAGILEALRSGDALRLPPLFSAQELVDLRARQVRALEAVDRLFPRPSCRATLQSSSPPITASCSVRMASLGTGQFSTRKSSRCHSSRRSSSGVDRAADISYRRVHLPSRSIAGWLGRR